MSNSIISNVFEFNKSVLGIEQRKPNFLSPEEYTISQRSLLEELDEFCESYDLTFYDDHTDLAQDLAEAIDAIIDLQYFAFGVLYKHGLTEQAVVECFNVVHEANMTKVLGRNAKRDTGAADAVKPENFIDPKTKIANIIRGLM